MRISPNNIEAILARQRITKKEFSSRCGVARTAISAIMRRGTCEPRTAGKLAEGLGVDVREILEEKNESSNRFAG